MTLPGTSRTMTKTIRLAKNSAGTSANNRRARYACIVRCPAVFSLQQEWTASEMLASIIATRAMRFFAEELE